MKNTIETIRARHYLLSRYFHALAQSRQVPTGVTWGDTEARTFGPHRAATPYRGAQLLPPQRPVAAFVEGEVVE